jgi:predicted helicase
VADDVALMVPVTNPFLRELMETFLNVGGRKRKANGQALDFDELGIAEVVEMLRVANMEAVLRDFDNRNPQEDPVIHFYELFLKEYDAQKRMQRGVFYTPKPVVSYIVRSVHELLQTEFGLEDGLASTVTWREMKQRFDCGAGPQPAPPPPPAPSQVEQKGAGKMPTPQFQIPDGAKPDDPFVAILDPAAGTGTFLVEVIDVIHRTMTAKWESGTGILPVIPGHGRDARATFKTFTDYWNAYVPRHLLPRLYGFELLMAPYAIAHMKIGLKLAETGYRFRSDERARIYLTNSLEPALLELQQKQIAEMSIALAHEAQAVNAIKRDQRFTVVIGNPPYSGISVNMTEHAQRLVDAYKVVDGEALNERKLWLQDDYVKFIRFAQTTIDAARTGVLGYITNHGYLDNPTFRGMRQSLMATFRRVRVLDLHGNANKKEQSPDGTEDNNVFDIRQGVAVCLATRDGTKVSVQHADLWGNRDSKYAWLASHIASNTPFAGLLPDSPYYFFEPQNTNWRGEYERGWRMNELMPVNSSGFITARDHFVVDFDREALLARIADLADPQLSDTEIRDRYFAGRGSEKYPDGDSRGWKLTETRRRVRTDRDWRKRAVVCLYRPFDRRIVYWADWMIDWPRPEVSGHMLAGPNLALQVCRQSVSDDWRHVLVASGLVESSYVSNKTREIGYVLPLYLAHSQAGLIAGQERVPNLHPRFLKEIAESLGCEPVKPHSLPRGLAAEDILYYAYSILHSPTYRTRYAEFLKIDFPRLPLTSNLEMFRELARLGGELVALHLMESPKLERLITTYIGPNNPEVGRVAWCNNTVWINAPAARKGQPARPGTIGFRGVPEEVWNFHIGGYQVCEKWLKDRKGRKLSKDDITHYQKIVVALSETIRIMGEVDHVIDQYGGWPGAFVTEPPASPPGQAQPSANPVVKVGSTPPPRSPISSATPTVVAPPRPATPATVVSDGERKSILATVDKAQEALGVPLLSLKSKIDRRRLEEILPVLVRQGVLKQSGTGGSARYSRG